MNPLNSAASARLLRLAAIASVVTAVLLIAGKLTAWLITGSVSVLASLADSMMDAAASLLNLLAVHYSLTPPDAEHRFGHGKAEHLAGLGQATFITGSAVFLILNAVDRLLHPQPIKDVTAGVIVMLFSIGLTLMLLAIQHYVIKRTGSTAIRADSLHYASDVLTNISTVVALLLAALGWPGLDPLFGMAIALYILYSAWEIGYEAVQLLMDHELPAEDQQRIEQIALRQAQVRGIHDLRTRRSGQSYFIQLHLELDPEQPFVKAHGTAARVEAALKHTFPNAEVLIHQDPLGADDHDPRALHPEGAG
ncbi:MAG: cation diffusion facilitator family transporter [Gammaproteobacteria bacterium]|nr:cation diffusion facilitator family transporter [Gammaproteobacteria bacterium]MCP5459604.1 cation diffusion facilitator family transporter [Gammaproteobacteria bacterium]